MAGGTRWCSPGPLGPDGRERGSAGSTDSVYFTAGPSGGEDGLFGRLDAGTPSLPNSGAPSRPPGDPAALALLLLLPGAGIAYLGWRRRRPA